MTRIRPPNRLGTAAGVSRNRAESDSYRSRDSSSSRSAASPPHASSKNASRSSGVHASARWYRSEIRSAMVRAPWSSLQVQGRNPRWIDYSGSTIHGLTPEAQELGPQLSGAAVRPVALRESSLISQFFANFQSLITVSGEISRTSAVSSMLNPPKNRSSTTCAFRSYCATVPESASSMAIRSS